MKVAVERLCFGGGCVVRFRKTRAPASVGLVRWSGTTRTALCLASSTRWSGSRWCCVWVMPMLLMPMMVVVVVMVVVMVMTPPPLVGCSVASFVDAASPSLPLSSRSVLPVLCAVLEAPVASGPACAGECGKLRGVDRRSANVLNPPLPHRHPPRVRLLVHLLRPSLLVDDADAGRPTLESFLPPFFFLSRGPLENSCLSSKRSCGTIGFSAWSL